jgi:hypothetical protein
MCADEKNDLRICTSWNLSAYMGVVRCICSPRAPRLQAIVSISSLKSKISRPANLQCTVTVASQSAVSMICIQLPAALRIQALSAEKLADHFGWMSKVEMLFADTGHAPSLSFEFEWLIQQQCPISALQMMSGNSLAP